MYRIYCLFSYFLLVHNFSQMSNATYVSMSHVQFLPLVFGQFFSDIWSEHSSMSLCCATCYATCSSTCDVTFVMCRVFFMGLVSNLWAFVCLILGLVLSVVQGPLNEGSMGEGIHCKVICSGCLVSSVADQSEMTWKYRC